MSTLALWRRSAFWDKVNKRNCKNTCLKLLQILVNLAILERFGVLPFDVRSDKKNDRESVYKHHGDHVVCRAVRVGGVVSRAARIDGTRHNTTGAAAAVRDASCRRRVVVSVASNLAQVAQIQCSNVTRVIIARQH